MNILIITIGTRGDVQPYVALGQALRAAGHDVALSTCCRFRSFVTDHGLAYEHLDDGLLQILDSAEGRAAVEDTTGIWQVCRTWVKLIRQVGPLQRQTVQDSWKAVSKSQPDLIVYHPKAFGGPHFADSLSWAQVRHQSRLRNSVSKNLSRPFGRPSRTRPY